MSTISMKNSYFLYSILLFILISLLNCISEVNGVTKTCSSNSFLCKDGVTCAGNHVKCDGEKDCPDGSDEENCDTKISCSSDSFLCKDGVTCAGNHVKCDGEKDCPNGSDEENCDDIRFCQNMKNNTNWACVDSKSCWYYTKYKNENRLDDYTRIQHCRGSKDLICCPNGRIGDPFCQEVKNFSKWKCIRKSECSYYDKTKDQNIADDDGRAIKCSHADDEMCCPLDNSAIKCGVSPKKNSKNESRIYGGRDAEFGVWAWQVSIRIKPLSCNKSEHLCGGVILNENWIVTAAHCLGSFSRLDNEIVIRAGEYNFSSTEEPHPFVERGVAEIVFHPQFETNKVVYNLAMLRLNSSLEYAPHIVPICLPKSDDLLIGENAIITGWGRLEKCGELPSVLQEAPTTILSNAECESVLRRVGAIGDKQYIPDINMCAGFPKCGRDACPGDLGGPLQVKGKDGSYFLAGIVSWGVPCTQPTLPGVYMRISKFVPWILRTIM